MKLVISVDHWITHNQRFPFFFLPDQRQMLGMKFLKLFITQERSHLIIVLLPRTLRIAGRYYFLSVQALALSAAKMFFATVVDIIAHHWVKLMRVNKLLNNIDSKGSREVLLQTPISSLSRPVITARTMHARKMTVFRSTKKCLKLVQTFWEWRSSFFYCYQSESRSIVQILIEVKVPWT